MEPGEFTHLLQRIDNGETSAAEKLLPLVYDELRRLAAARMARESAAHTLQPTALVHEAWLRLGGDREAGWKNRAHFFAAAAEAMRRILIERARRSARLRHGGALVRVDFNATGLEVAAPEMTADEFLLLHEALDNLAAVDARKAELVKQWFFVGLTVEQVAESLDISPRTAAREWACARAWLVAEMDRLRA